LIVKVVKDKFSDTLGVRPVEQIDALFNKLTGEFGAPRNI